MLVRHLSKGIHWRQTTVNQRRGDILYIHGLGESGLCFEKLMQRAELADWGHHAPDLPGFGKSLWLENPAALDDLAALACRWIDENFNDSVIVVGHSMGGVVGQLVCEMRPEMTAGFINVEGNLSRDDCVFSGQAAELPLTEFLEEGFERLLGGVYANGVRDPAQRGYYASLCFADPRQFHANSRELVDLSSRETLAERFAKLPLKARLFVAGLRGGLSPRSLQLLRDKRPPWIGFEESGHWPFLSEEDRFTKVLRHFLEQL